MLNGVPGGDPLTFSIAVVAAASAGLLVYRDADRHSHYHALSASAAVGIASLVGFFVANLVGLGVATGYVLLLYLLSYPSTPGIDGEETRRTPDRSDGSPQGDAGENIAAAETDDVVSVIRVEIATEDTLRELAERYDDVPNDAPVAKLRSMLRVKALSTVVDEAETDDEFTLRDWAEAEYDEGVDDWHDESPSDESERPSSGAAAWNAASPGEGATTEDASAAARSENGSTPTETGSSNDIEEWTAETVDEDADEVEAGSIEKWTAVEDGEEPRSSAGDEATASESGQGSQPSDSESASADSTATTENEWGVTAGEEASSVTTTNEDEEDDGFGWAEVEAEQ